ncbi:MAG: hypothetical protein JO199_03865 [Candidatus Eremiobacteraeota bacterium]|nr:hypothetical protein [Candidatus Eremiobacteraeota bacterium]
MTAADLCIGRALSVRASIAITLEGTPSEAFPFFDPVHETQWDPEWRPQLLDDRVREGLVFFVGEGADRVTWVIARYDERAPRIAYVNVGRSIATRIEIALAPKGSERCTATVDYEKTALDADAESSVRHFAAHFPTQGPRWESAINAVLRKRTV